MQYEVGWSEGTLHDASRQRDIGFLLRYPKNCEGLVPIVLLSHGGYGSSFGQYAFRDLATAYARLGFLAVSIGHRQSANEIQHRYDRPLDVSFVIDALVRTRAASLRIPGGGGEGVLPMPPDFAGTADVDHIGHIGHSFTAHAVGGANWSPTMGIRDFRDPRVDAIVPISPQGYHRFGSYDEGPDNNSWSEIRIPAYLICGELEGPEWRRQPFDRYPAIGDKFFTIAKGWGHNLVNGDAATKRLLGLNTALFFHTYLRQGNGRDRIGTLAWIDGWTLERKPEKGPANPKSTNGGGSEVHE
jgi:predicted dienelactone hydrolase